MKVAVDVRDWIIAALSVFAVYLGWRAQKPASGGGCRYVVEVHDSLRFSDGVMVREERP